MPIGAGAGGEAADGQGVAGVVAEVGGLGRGRLVTPGVEAGVVAAAGALPLGLGRQPAAGPARIVVRLLPVDMADRMVGELRRIPAVHLRRRAGAVGHAAAVLGVRHLGALQPETVHAHRMRRLLLLRHCIRRIRPHRELTPRHILVHPTILLAQQRHLVLWEERCGGRSWG